MNGTRKSAGAAERTDALAELIGRIGRLIHARQYAAGLNPAQWEALRYVDRANLRSRTPGALADYLGTTKGTASQTLIALEEKGLIRRDRSDRDRRQVEISLTEAGRGRLKDDPIDLLRSALGALPIEAERTLLTALSDLLDRLRRADGLTAFGMCGLCRHFGCQEDGAGDSAPATCCLTGDALGASDWNGLCVNYDPMPAARAVTP